MKDLIASINSIISVWLSRLLFIVLFVLTINCYPQGVSVNLSGAAADVSAMLDVSGTTKGVLINRMTTAERNAIVNPAQSLLIYNTSVKCFEFYENGAWVDLGCVCNLPDVPVPGNNIASAAQIIWNWNASNGATGYKYNTVNDYQAATDAGGSLTFTQTGLICNTSYSLYVWAYNLCGVASYVVLHQSTSACPFSCNTGTVSFIYRGLTVTYGTVVGQNGTCWLDRNLGASQVAIAYNDALAYGDLFQWGRGDDGHQDRSSNITDTLSISDVPGHSKYINPPSVLWPNSSPFDWRSPQNNYLWQGGNGGINNPCPAGWRVPTYTEFENEWKSWASNSSVDAYATPLKWTVGGERSGALGNVGSCGYYWTSTVSGSETMTLRICDSEVWPVWMHSSSGCSVRCIKN